MNKKNGVRLFSDKTRHGWRGNRLLVGAYRCSWVHAHGRGAGVGHHCWLLYLLRISRPDSCGRQDRARWRDGGRHWRECWNGGQRRGRLHVCDVIWVDHRWRHVHHASSSWWSRGENGRVSGFDVRAPSWSGVQVWNRSRWSRERTSCHELFKTKVDYVVTRINVFIYYLTIQ